MSDYGTGIATGTATGVALGLAAKEETEAKGRRMFREGIDQILIETKLTPENAANEVASTNSEWYSDDNKIFRRIFFSWGNFGFFAFMTGMVILLVYTLVPILLNYDRNIENEWYKNFPLSFWTSILISTIVGIVFGRIERDDQVDYIKICQIDNKTYVQLDIYNSSGYRNIDGLEILKIKNALE